VLTETEAIGRTPQFTPVHFSGRTAPPGHIIDVSVCGHDGRQLIAA
jgi:tRNA A37 methylthiotransferase MiaB